MKDILENTLLKSAMLMPQSQLSWFVQFTAEHLTLSVVMESKCWMSQHLAAIPDQMSDIHTTDIQLKLLKKKRLKIETIIWNVNMWMQKSFSYNL